MNDNSFIGVDGAFKLTQQAASHLQQAFARGEVSPRVLRAYWTMVAYTLTNYTHQQNWPDGPAGAPAQQIPLNIAHILAKAAQYFSRGLVPGIVEGVKGKSGGRPPIGPDEEKAICAAVAYVKAARRGLPQDPKHIATICDAYGVSRSTVQSWVRRYGWVEPDLFILAVDPADAAGAVITRMKTEGAAYKVMGRSSGAVMKRASKRRLSTKP